MHHVSVLEWAIHGSIQTHNNVNAMLAIREIHVVNRVKFALLILVVIQVVMEQVLVCVTILIFLKMDPVIHLHYVIVLLIDMEQTALLVLYVLKMLYVPTEELVTDCVLVEQQVLCKPQMEHVFVEMIIMDQIVINNALNVHWTVHVMEPKQEMADVFVVHNLSLFILIHLISLFNLVNVHLVNMVLLV